MFAPGPISRPPSEGLFSPFGLQIPQAISTIPAPPTTTTAAHLRPAPTRNTTTRNTASTSGTTNTTLPQPHYNPHVHWVKLHEASHTRAKTNIARFGATWLRPAGCSKTLQAQEDEVAERAEQEEQERRQRGLAEAVAAQEADERRRRANGGVGGDGAMEGVVVPGLEGQPAAVGEGGEGLGMERDLDEEVPDGEGQENVDMDEGDEEEDEDEGEEDGDEDADSSGEELDNPLTAVFDDEDEGEPVTMERNLDSDIPEASGEYEHTDTEIEDETEEISISQGLDGTSEVDLRSSTLSRQQQSQQRRSVQRQQQPQQPRPQYRQEQIQPPRTGFGTVSAAPRMIGIAMSPGVFTSSPIIEHEGNASLELESSVFGPSEAEFMSGSPSMGMMRPPGAPRRR